MVIKIASVWQNNKILRKWEKKHFKENANGDFNYNQAYPLEDHLVIAISKYLKVNKEYIYVGTGISQFINAIVGMAQCKKVYLPEIEFALYKRTALINKKDNITYTKTIKAKNESEAKKILAEVITEVEGNTFQKNIKLTFTQFTQYWLDNHARPTLSITTTNNYINMLNKRILSSIGMYKLSDIKKPHIVKYISSLKDKNLNYKTQLKHLKLISAILNYAIELDLLKTNVCSTIKVKKDTTEIHKEMQVYNHKELKQLHHALNLEENKELVNMILIDLYTGLRRGELMGLMPQDINFEEGTIKISRNRICNNGVTEIKSTKNHKTRTFILPTNALLIFKDICKNKKEDELLFPIHPDTFSSQFKKFLKRNNLKDIRVYDLRHTNASILQSEGIDFATIANMLGNLPSTTANFYIHKINEKDKQAKNILENIF